MGMTFLLRNVRLEPDGPVTDLCLNAGHLEERTAGRQGIEIEGDGGLLLPGMIDPHVHLRSPGLEAAEDWASGTRAALRGGVTTLFDMPNTRPPTTNRARLEEKRVLARVSLVNWGLHLGATDDNAAEIAAVADSIASVKVYLGSSTGDLLVTSEEALERIFRAAAAVRVPVSLHAEDEAIVRRRLAAAASGGAPPTPQSWGESDRSAPPTPQEWGEPHPKAPPVSGGVGGPNPKAPPVSGEVGGPLAVSAHGWVRPPAAAAAAVQRALALGERTGATLYFCHVSTAAELALLREAKAKGQPVYVEAAPHHLLLSEEDLAALGNFGKVNPPLRSAADRAALWAAIEDGTVDTLGTDHAPHPRAAKEQPYPQAPSGMPGLEVALPLMLTALSQGRLSFQRLVELTSARAAALFGIRPLDWVLVDMETVQTLQAGQPDQSAPPTPQEWGEPDQSAPPVSGGLGGPNPKAPPVSGGLGGLPILSRCGWSPYVGWRLRGWPLYVWVNGELAYDRGRFGLAGLGREVVFRRR